MDMDAIPVAGMDRLELLQVADAVAREKSIERDEVLEAMEQAIQKAADRNTARSTMSAPISTARAAISNSPGSWKSSRRSRTRSPS